VNDQGQPHRARPTQQKVLDWVDKVRRGEVFTDGTPILYLQGGIGCGKTRAFIAAIQEMQTQIPNLRVLWGREDFNDLVKSAKETYFEVLPTELLINKNEQYHWYDILQNSGEKSRIYFSGLKDTAGLGSQEFGVIVVTEVHEITFRAFETLVERCRQAKMPNMILMEGNPPNEDHWLVKSTTPGKTDFNPDITLWEVSTYENWDALAPGYRNSLERRPESWKKKYLYGKPGFTPDGTPFYAGFKERLHKKKLNYIDSRPLIRSWDYGFHHPACSFHQIDAKGRWLILREVMGTDVTIQEFGNLIKTLCNEWYPGAQWEDYGDPAGNQVSDKSEKTSVEILASMGIDVTSKVSTYRERKEIIERKLATLIDGMPSLLVDESCKTIVDGFLGGYHYPIRKPNQGFNPNVHEVPYRDGFYEHLQNSVEYFAVNMFEGAETKQDTSEPIIKTVGPFKDVKIEYEDDDSKYSEAYRLRLERNQEGVDEEPRSVRYVQG